MNDYRNALPLLKHCKKEISKTKELARRKKLFDRIPEIEGRELSAHMMEAHCFFETGNLGKAKSGYKLVKSRIRNSEMSDLERWSIMVSKTVRRHVFTGRDGSRTR